MERLAGTWRNTSAGAVVAGRRHRLAPIIRPKPVGSRHDWAVRVWGGRFAGSEDTDERVAAFGRSIDVDAALALDDLDGSIAHVRGLGRAGILTDAEVETLVDGLRDLRRDVENGEVRWDPELEDIHLNVEAALTERLGPVAGKLHSGPAGD